MREYRNWKEMYDAHRGRIETIIPVEYKEPEFEKVERPEEKKAPAKKPAAKKPAKKKVD